MNVYLTFQKGNGEWSHSETKPIDYFKYDCWGPFENDFEATVKEHELRGIPPPRRFSNAGLETAAS